MRAVPRGMQSLAAAWNSLHSFVLTRPCAVDRTLQSKREPTTSFFFFASHLPVRLDSTDTLFHVSHCPLLSLKQYFCKYWCHGLSSVLSAVDLTVLILCFTHHIISCCLWSSTFSKHWCHGLSFVLSAIDLTVLILCFTCHVLSLPLKLYFFKY